jgi:cytochrome subunit of sulfide dehydrogenase
VSSLFASQQAVRRLATLLLSVLVLAGTDAAAVTAGAPPGASSCSGCHASSITVNTPVPRILGRQSAEIVAAMQAFRTGERRSTVMSRIAKGFSEDEIQAIAAWLATPH